MALSETLSSGGVQTRRQMFKSCRLKGKALLTFCTSYSTSDGSSANVNISILRLDTTVSSSAQVTCNGQDYTDSGITFLYQADATVNSISLSSGLDPGGFGLFITGEHFVNSSTLSCRTGGSNTAATFLSSNLVLCFVPRATAATALASTAQGVSSGDATRGLGPREGDNSSPGAWLGPEDQEGKTLFVEVCINMLL